MRATRFVLTIAVMALATGLALGGCSKDDDNNPPTGPGGPELNSGSIGAGNTFQHTFASTGTFPYHCSIHAMMTGSVTVALGQPVAVNVNIANSTATGFQPSSISVAPGGTVTWTNNDGIAHTVTSD